MLLLSAALLLAQPAPATTGTSPVPSASPAPPRSPVPSSIRPAADPPPAPVPSTSPAPPRSPVPSDSTPTSPAVPDYHGVAPTEPVRDEFVRGPLKDRTLPAVRAGFGGAYAPRAAPATGLQGGFAFDITLGASIQVHRRVFLWPEVGYSLAVRDQRTGHFVIAGMTPMFGGRLAQIGVAPRLVAGDAWGAPGVGVRTSLVGGVLYNILMLEVGHQWLRADHRDQHDVRFMISVDLVPTTMVVAVFIGLARFFRRIG